MRVLVQVLVVVAGMVSAGILSVLLGLPSLSSPLAMIAGGWFAHWVVFDRRSPVAMQRDAKAHRARELSDVISRLPRK